MKQRFNTAIWKKLLPHSNDSVQPVSQMLTWPRIHTLNNSKTKSNSLTRKMHFNIKTKNRQQTYQLIHRRYLDTHCTTHTASVRLYIINRHIEIWTGNATQVNNNINTRLMITKQVFPLEDTPMDGLTIAGQTTPPISKHNGMRL